MGEKLTSHQEFTSLGSISISEKITFIEIKIFIV